MSNKNYRLIVMTKTPEAGKVKTRMQPDLTLEQSALLQDALIKQVMGEWQEADYSIDLWFSGDESYFQDESYHKYHQVDGDLGARMSAAAKHAFDKDHLGVLITGTDCPFIDNTHLSYVAEYLSTYDVVIIPALDGGYVLIAMNTYYPELFQDITWGTDQVFRQTHQKLSALGLNFKVLDALPDIDVVEDLKYLKEERFIPELRKFSTLYL